MYSEYRKYLSQDERDEMDREHDLEFMRDPARPLTECITRGLTETPEFEALGSHPGQPAQLTLPGFTPKHRRPLWRPNPAMRKLHRRIVIRTQELFQFGSHIDSLRWQFYRHNNHRYVYHADLKSAFTAVNSRRLATILFEVDRRTLPPNEVFSFGWGRSIADIDEMLRRYCMDPIRGGLIQGGPASSCLFDIYVESLLDDHLLARAATDGWWPLDTPQGPTWSYQQGLAYSRLADDMVFSSAQPIGRHKRAHINQVIRAAGFSINPQKTRVYDLRRKPVVINGVGVRLGVNGLRTYLPRPQLRRIEGLLHRALTDESIDPSLVHGVMGWFYGITDRKTLNHTEERVIRAYMRYRASIAVPPVVS